MPGFAPATTSPLRIRPADTPTAPPRSTHVREPTLSSHFSLLTLDLEPWTLDYRRLPLTAGSIGRGGAVAFPVRRSPPAAPAHTRVSFPASGSAAPRPAPRSASTGSCPQARRYRPADFGFRILDPSVRSKLGFGL